MALPTSYTESTFIDYMVEALAGVGALLGWSVVDDYDEVVNDVLLAYGVSDITTVTGTDNLRKLRGLGKLIVWEKVIAATALDFDFSADNASFSRSQVNEMAKGMVAQARASLQQIAPELDGYAVLVDTVYRTQDPYQYWPDEERTR